MRLQENMKINLSQFKLHEAYDKHTVGPKIYESAGISGCSISQCPCGMWVFKLGASESALVGLIAGHFLREHPEIAPDLEDYWLNLRGRCTPNKTAWGEIVHISESRGPTI